MNNMIFRENAPDMSEKEVLEYLLQFTRTTVTPETLLDRFGTLKNVLEASATALQSVPGVTPKTATLISSFLPMTRVYTRLSMQEQTRIANRRELEAYCKSFLSGLQHEEFWVICVNAQCKLIGKRKISSGTLSEVSAYPRKVVETALNYNAHSIFFAHNHPGGTCSPSAEDIASTIQLKKALSAIGVNVLDHIIIAGELSYSLAQHGDM